MYAAKYIIRSYVRAGKTCAKSQAFKIEITCYSDVMPIDYVRTFCKERFKNNVRIIHFIPYVSKNQRTIRAETRSLCRITAVVGASLRLSDIRMDFSFPTPLPLHARPIAVRRLVYTVDFRYMTNNC